MWDVCIRNARLFDPRTRLDIRGDLAVQGDRIAALGPKIGGAAQLDIDAHGALLTPGIADIHTHVSPRISHLGLEPDAAGVQRAVTLVGDAGSGGTATIRPFLDLDLPGAKTMVKVFLNVHPQGVAELPEDWSIPFDFDAAAAIVQRYRERICGIKLRAMAGFAAAQGFSGLERAKQFATDMQLPFMVHIGTDMEDELPECWDNFCRALPQLLSAGDVISHCYTPKPGGLITPDRRFYPVLEKAVQRGVLLDSAVALAHFSFPTARQGMRDGFLPHCISTDLTVRSTGKRVFSLAATMSRFLALGMSLDAVLRCVTSTAYSVLGVPCHGLRPGAPADLSILNIREEPVTFMGYSDDDQLTGHTLLVPQAAVRAGSYIAAAGKR